MWHTSRTEGLDDPRHSKRGPFFNLTNLFGTTLRLGFMLEFAALSAMVIVYWLYGGSGFFSYDLSGMTEDARASKGFLCTLATLQSIYLCGSVVLLIVQIGLADDASWSRGYRSGSKVLRIATFFDVLSSSLLLVFYFFMSKHYTEQWYSHFSSGGSEWLFMAFARMLRAVAFGWYAAATYLLEVYHDEGAGDTHGYINGVAFIAACLLELWGCATPKSTIAPATLWIALLSVCAWAIFFEVEVNYISPALYETELTNEVEQQVERFARVTPQVPGQISTPMDGPMAQYSGRDQPLQG